VIRQGGAVTLTKADLAQKIVDDSGSVKGGAAEILEQLLDVIKSRLISGEDVMISGFEKWNVKSKRALSGRNPKNGHEIVLDARRVMEIFAGVEKGGECTPSVRSKLEFRHAYSWVPADLREWVRFLGTERLAEKASMQNYSASTLSS
jgi:integration host factor subunit alpha